MIDIRKAKTVSALWRYAGLGVTDGKADREKHGQKRQYNVRLKATLGLLAKTMLRKQANGDKISYRVYYDRAREKYDARGFTPGHAHLAAVRIMLKQLLKDLWLVWRRALGMEVTEPYQDRIKA